MRAALEQRKKEEEALRLARVQDQLAAQQRQKDLHRALDERVRKSKQTLMTQRRKAAEKLRKEEVKLDAQRERDRAEELKANSLRYVSVRTNVEIGVSRSLSSLAIRRAADVEQINLMRMQREEEMRRRHVEETRALQARWDAMRSRPGTAQFASQRSPSSLASPSPSSPAHHAGTPLPPLSNPPQPTLSPLSPLDPPPPEPLLTPIVVSSRGGPDSDALPSDVLVWDYGDGGEERPQTSGCDDGGQAGEVGP